MPTYLPITDGIETKRYLATSAYPTKPYLHVGNDVIPLTTNTTNGLQLKVKVGTQTYRLMEYGSESASATYYTSAEVSEGLSEVTALTRESTSGESYLTRESTSGEIYGTSAENYLTRWGMRSSSGDDYLVDSYVYNSVTRKITTYSSEYNSNTYTYKDATDYASDPPHTAAQSNLGFSYTYDTYASYQTNSSKYYTFNPNQTVTSYLIGTPGETHTSYEFIAMNNRPYGGFTRIYYGGNVSSFNTDYWTWGITSYYSEYEGGQWTPYGTINRYTVSGRKVTTDTTYLTCESTYATEYFTCESTYGYSGISSSSSESSGWQ